jgi:uncharacterized membrane protein YcaP (DUF421 family)
MEWSESIPDLIGTEPASITWWQMTIRAAVVFVFGLLLVRIFGQRAFGRQTVLDVILAIVIGSNLSRTMTASAPLWPTLAATTGLVLLYWVFNHMAARWHRLSWLVKGGVIQLAHDGRMDRKAMLRTGISEGDILEAMRRSGIENVEEVRSAYLERNGKISVLT